LSGTIIIEIDDASLQNYVNIRILIFGGHLTIVIRSFYKVISMTKVAKVTWH
jgi:hypothetical protein